MSTEITWLGHNAWSIQAGEHRLLLDPFFNDNPLSPKKANQVEADFILVSHGHGDHIGDTVEIASRTGATVIGTSREYCQQNVQIIVNCRVPLDLTEITGNLESEYWDLPRR